MADPISPSPYTVVFVCTGNTCRSPMAEGILRRLVSEQGNAAPLIIVESAGTLGWEGMPATAMATEVASEFGVDIADHRSQDATSELLLRADLILALAPEHYEYARRMGVPDGHVYMLRGFPNHPKHWRELSVPDPMGGARAAYERAYFLIEEAIRKALPEILRRAGTKSRGETAAEAPPEPV